MGCPAHDLDAKLGKLEPVNIKQAPDQTFDLPHHKNRVWTLLLCVWKCWPHCKMFRHYLHSTDQIGQYMNGAMAYTDDNVICLSTSESTLPMWLYYNTCTWPDFFQLFRPCCLRTLFLWDLPTCESLYHIILVYHWLKASHLALWRLSDCFVCRLLAKDVDYLTGNLPELSKWQQSFFNSLEQCSR